METISKMSKEEMNNFKPNSEMVKSAEVVFLSMAYVETIKPIVEDIQKKVLNKHKFEVDKEHRNYEKEKVITEIKLSYLMSDKDFKVYHSECRTLEDKKGLKVSNPEFCPLLIAEHNLIKAENLLIDVFSQITGLKHSDIYKTEHRKRFIDLTLSFLSPYVDKEKVLRGVLNG